MALKFVSIGSLKNVHVYEDGTYPSAIETDGVIEAGQLVVGGSNVVVGDQPNIVSLTDSTGGTADNTVQDVGASFNQATLNNNFADLTAKINQILTALDNSGLTL
jgi:hypothetical protein